MKFTLDSWIVVVRAFPLESGEVNFVPKWIRVSEIDYLDIVFSKEWGGPNGWCGIEEFKVIQDCLVITAIKDFHCPQEVIDKINLDVRVATKKLVEDSNFNTPGVRSKGFRRNSSLASAIPDCIRDMFVFHRK
jgi:hypothetical protein